MVAALSGLIVISLGVPAGVIVGALGPTHIGRGDSGTICPTPARLARRASTKLLARITQLVKLLLLQGGQFLILFRGVVTVGNLAGGKFFCTEDALAAVSPSTSTSAVTGLVAHVGCRCRQFSADNVVSADMSATCRLADITCRPF